MKIIRIAGQDNSKKLQKGNPSPDDRAGCGKCHFSKQRD